MKLLAPLIALVLAMSCSGGTGRETLSAPADAPTRDESSDIECARRFLRESGQSENLAETYAKVYGDQICALADLISPPTPKPALSGHHLALLSASCQPYSAGSPYSQCQGFVKNLSADPLPFVRIVIEWLDANGTPQRSDEGAVKSQPLAAGEEAGWQVMTQPGGLTAFRVRARDAFGASYNLRDDRPR